MSATAKIMENRAKKTKTFGGNRKLKLFCTVLFAVFALAFFCIKFTVVKGPFFVLKLTSFLVASPSMEPEYPTYSIVVVKKESFSDIKVGDVIVYKADALGGNLAFHRVIRVASNGVYTKGDNSRLADNQLITEETYVGKGILNIAFLSDYIKSLHHPTGFFIFFVFPVAATVLLISSLRLIFRKKDPVD